MEIISDKAGNIANSLQTGICSSSPVALNVTDESLRAMDKHIKSFPLSRSTLSVSNRRLLDFNGTQLWNTCVQALAGRDDVSERRALSRILFFSFNMLESAVSRRSPGNWRMLEIALVAAKSFLKNAHLEPGLKALETAAARLDSLKKLKPTETSKLSTITAEYYMLRMYLSWLQGRPDIAEHFFKTSKPLEHLDARKTIVEICYTIGDLALSKNQSDISLVWLERALYPCLWSGAIEQTDPALKDMRLLSLHAFAHLQLSTPDSWNYVYDGLNSLQTEISNDQEKKDTYILPVTVLQLEVFSREQQPNYEKYIECLQTLIQAIDMMTEYCLGVILYHARKISSWSMKLSIETFQQLIPKVITGKNQNFIDHCFVTFFWVVTVTEKHVDQDLEIIANMLSSLTDYGYSPLSEEACHASLALIWKQIELSVSANDFLIAQKWCLLALNQPLFENCSAENRAIFQRKRLLCAIESHSLVSHPTLAGILHQYRDTSSTLCLVYKLALLHGYNDLAATAGVFIRASPSSIDT